MCKIIFQSNHLVYSVKTVEMYITFYKALTAYEVVGIDFFMLFLGQYHKSMSITVEMCQIFLYSPWPQPLHMYIFRY